MKIYTIIQGDIMDGIIVINKPAGMTSHDVIGCLRRKYKQKKFGHSGTLDPEATGVLIVLCGNATKILQFLSDTDKTYEATIKLGASTTTDDIWGEEVDHKPVNLDFDFSEELNKFVGLLHQKVPMTSAKKIQGKKLMDYQREGLSVPDVYQDVEVYSIESLSDEDLRFKVHCSSGTYVRSICRDVALNTGNAGCMSSLVRTQVGRFSIDQAQSIDEEHTLYPIEMALDGFEQMEYSPVQDIYNGKHVRLDTDKDQVCIMEHGKAIAIYERHHGNVFGCKRGLW